MGVYKALPVSKCTAISQFTQFSGVLATHRIISLPQLYRDSEHTLPQQLSTKYHTLMHTHTFSMAYAQLWRKMDIVYTVKKSTEVCANNMVVGLKTHRVHRDGATH